MDVSIIIVNYKTPELIIKCIESIFTFTKSVSYEIIVVNNLSKANDEEQIKSAFPAVKWVEMGYNSGFGRANNAGMKVAIGKYLLLLNSDTTMINNAIGECFLKLENRSDAIAAGAYQLFPDLRPRAFYNTFTFQRQFWIVPLQFRKILEKLIPQKKYEDPEQVDYIAAAFLMLRREGFEKTGGFDEEFFLYGEDNDFGYRLSKYGKLLIFKDLSYIHDEWGSKPERYLESKNYTYFNRFDHQIQLSNLVWIRKQYGALRFLALMIHYWLWVPVFYFMKIFSNILKLRNPLSDLENQKRFAHTISVFSSYFWKILLKKPTFYKIS